MAFYSDSRNKDGLQGSCKNCQNLKRNERYLTDQDYAAKVKDNQKKYKEKASERAKKHIQNLSDFYIIKELKRGTQLTTEDIKKHPQLIAAKRELIRLKRLCR